MHVHENVYHFSGSPATCVACCVQVVNIRKNVCHPSGSPATCVACCVQVVNVRENVYHVSGSPATCVNIGIYHLGEDCDFVISGPNVGHNAGRCVSYECPFRWCNGNTKCEKQRWKVCSLCMSCHVVYVGYIIHRIHDVGYIIGGGVYHAMSCSFGVTSGPIVGHNARRGAPHACPAMLWDGVAKFGAHS